MGREGLFTGIITHIGRVEDVQDGESLRDIVVATDLPLDEVAPGASVAHSGVCLTVVETMPGALRVQASPETLARTTLGSWRAGTRVNLERSLRLGDELGGHLVFGHVDAVGELLAIDALGQSWRFEIGIPHALAPLLAVKGSIAVDGISLTITESH